MSSRRRVVIKLGTQIVVDTTTGTPALERISAIVRDIAKRRVEGDEIILVSSGAVGMGRQALGVSGSPTLAAKQACAAVGGVRPL
jgi:glutamate 5-kinase